MSRTILVTGFEPFGGEMVNSSWEAARAIDGWRCGDAVVVAVRLPCAYGACVAEFVGAFERLRPEAVLMTGQAARRAVVSVESVARKRSNAAAPDNRGVVCGSAASDGPATVEASAAARAVARAICELGVAARVSTNAGGYVCNHLYYGALNYPARAGAGDAGFVRPSAGDAGAESARSEPAQARDHRRCDRAQGGDPGDDEDDRALRSRSTSGISTSNGISAASWKQPCRLSAGSVWVRAGCSLDKTRRRPSSGAARHLLPQAGEGNAPAGGSFRRAYVISTISASTIALLKTTRVERVGKPVSSGGSIPRGICPPAPLGFKQRLSRSQRNRPRPAFSGRNHSMRQTIQEFLGTIAILQREHDWLIPLAVEGPPHLRPLRTRQLKSIAKRLAAARSEEATISDEATELVPGVAAA